MAKKDYPVTPAIRVIRDLKIDFEPYEYEYQDKGGTAQTAIELKVDEHNVIKTLVMESESDQFIVLMHGDREVSTKELARQIGSKKAEPCKAETAHKLTGYMFGGTSPFGTRKQMQVYAESSIFNLDTIYINGGKRGFIIGIKPESLKIAFDLKEVNVAIQK